MVSITLAVPEEIKQKMDEFSEINWSGFIRKEIIKKTKELELREKLLKELEKEKAVMDWAVKLQKTGRKGRFEKLKKKGLI